VGQNAKYAMHVFANHGMALRGVRHDTLLQSYILESHKPSVFAAAFPGEPSGLHAAQAQHERH
jgi:DNA polymerase I-like protein with 3'-5' exonuclease and polymerase domains